MKPGEQWNPLGGGQARGPGSANQRSADRERGKPGLGARSLSSLGGDRPGRAGPGIPGELVPGQGVGSRGDGSRGGVGTHEGGDGIWDPLPAQAAARGLHPSHRWNRFLNCIDSPLLLEGRELRLVSAGGRVHGPHGLGLLRRPPGCPAHRLAGQGRSGPGRKSGQGRGQTRRLGGGREAA